MRQRSCIFLVIVLGSICLSCGPRSNHEEVVHPVSDVIGAFGDPIGGTESVTVEQMYQDVVKTGVFEGVVVGKIKDVCTQKGCWMTIDLPDGREMRVTFKDYGFFVPKDSKGYQVRMEGIAQPSVTDVATLRHYAEDAGKSREEVLRIDQPEMSISFEASGVVIEAGT